GSRDRGARSPCRLRRLDRLVAARHDPALVFFPGRCGAAIFNRLAVSPRTNVRAHARPRGVARAALDLARRLPALRVSLEAKLDFRGHVVANWIRLRVLIPARLLPAALAMARPGADSRRVLGCFCALSGPRIGLRLESGRRRAKLGLQLPGL